MTVASNSKPGIAAKRIAAFERRFGRSHLYLAYHAAFPAALTPNLLYRLRLNFQQDSSGLPLDIPWIAVSDLLLSNLCYEVGYEVYQMDIAVRDELISRLQQDIKFGQRRIKLLSYFLLDYVQQELQNGDMHTQLIAQVQRWVALSYTQPHKTAYEIASFLAQLNLTNKAELLRLEVLCQTLSIPLEQFQPLFSYIRGLATFARGNFAEAANLLKPLLGSDRQIRIVGVKLPIPAPVQNLLDATLSYPSYRHADLQGMSFKNQDLSNADFSYANLRDTDFTNANLIGANFSHAMMGLRLPWTIALVTCAILLSISAGVGAMLISYFLQASLINAPSQEIFTLTITVLLLSVIIGAVLMRLGIEATLGAFVFTLVGALYVLIAISGVIEFAGFTTAWDWITRILLAITGMIGFAIGVASSRLGVLNFAAKWASLWTGGSAIGITIWSVFGLQYLLNQYTPWVVVGIGDSKLKTWLENSLNSQNELVYFTMLAILIGVVGTILIASISIALAKSVNPILAISIGLAWIPFWLGRLGLGESLLRSGGAIATVFLIAGLGTYIGWRSLAEDPRYSFLTQASVAFTSKFLNGTKFCGANLTDANFSNATLAYANFTDANLTRVSWFQSKALKLAHFTEPYLRIRQIQVLIMTGRGQGSVLNGLSLQGINLSGTDLSDVCLINTDLRNANLQDANLSRSKLSQTQLDQADLTGVCLTGATIQNWKITPSTRLDGIECDYIYTRLPTPDNPDPVRQPIDQSIFEPGDFVDFIQNVEQ